MAYNNYFPATYQQQYYPQYQQVQVPQAQPQENNGIIWISGIEGAKSYLVGAGKSVLLMDSESSTFYIKSTDVSGMPQPLRIFDYSERTEQVKDVSTSQIDTSNFVTREELEDRLSALTNARTTKGTVAK